MKSVSSFPQILLYVGRVDFRKSIDGLSGIAESSMGVSPYSSTLFVFVSRCKRRMKILYWDKTGFALWQKRLEKERYCFPKKRELLLEPTIMSLSQSHLEMLLEGIDVFKIKPHTELNFTCVT